MTSTALINEINALSDTANKKINTRRAMITKELNNTEDVISAIALKITKQQDTIRDIRTKLLEKSIACTKAKGDDIVKIENDKKTLQLALATTRKEQQRLISQNSELQGKLDELQREFENSNSSNLQKLEQIKSSLKIMTSSLDSEAQTLGTKLSNVNKGLETVLEDPMLEVGGLFLPLEVDPQTVTPDDEPEVDGEEPDVEVDGEEPDVEVDGEEPDVELEDEEPELEDEEPELEEEEPELEEEEVEVEGLDEVEDMNEEEPELSLEFGKYSGMRIIDSDDEF